MTGKPAAPLRGWQTHAGTAPAACAGCGRTDRALHQGRRFTPDLATPWADAPDALLCDACRDALLDTQRTRGDAAHAPRPWWRFW